MEPCRERGPCHDRGSSAPLMVPVAYVRLCAARQGIGLDVADQVIVLNYALEVLNPSRLIGTRPPNATPGPLVFKSGTVLRKMGIRPVSPILASRRRIREVRDGRHLEYVTLSSGEFATGEAQCRRDCHGSFASPADGRLFPRWSETRRPGDCGGVPLTSCRSSPSNRDSRRNKRDSSLPAPKATRWKGAHPGRLGRAIKTTYGTRKGREIRCTITYRSVKEALVLNMSGGDSLYEVPEVRGARILQLARSII